MTRWIILVNHPAMCNEVSHQLLRYLPNMDNVLVLSRINIFLRMSDARHHSSYFCNDCLELLDLMRIKRCISHCPTVFFLAF